METGDFDINNPNTEQNALEQMSEDEVVNTVLRAEQEVASGKIFRGNTRDVLSSK